MKYLFSLLLISAVSNTYAADLDTITLGFGPASHWYNNIEHEIDYGEDLNSSADDQVVINEVTVQESGYVLSYMEQFRPGQGDIVDGYYALEFYALEDSVGLGAEAGVGLNFSDNLNAGIFAGYNTLARSTVAGAYFIRIINGKLSVTGKVSVDKDLDLLASLQLHFRSKFLNKKIGELF